MRPLGVVEMIDIDDQHWVSPIFLAAVVGGETENREPDKLEALIWAPLEAAPAPLALAASQAIAALTAAIAQRPGP